MKKKLLAALLSTAMVASVLAGCGETNAPVGSTEAEDTAVAASDAAATDAAAADETTADDSAAAASSEAEPTAV